MRSLEPSERPTPRWQLAARVGSSLNDGDPQTVHHQARSDRPATIPSRRRLHSSLGDIPPVEFEQLHAARAQISLDGSVAVILPKPANGLTTRRVPTVGVDFEVNRPISSTSAPALPTRIRSGRDNGNQGTNDHRWPLRPVVKETYSLTGTSKPTTPTTEEPT